MTAFILRHDRFLWIFQILLAEYLQLRELFGLHRKSRRLQLLSALEALQRLGIVVGIFRTRKSRVGADDLLLLLCWQKQLLVLAIKPILWRFYSRWDIPLRYIALESLMILVLPLLHVLAQTLVLVVDGRQLIVLVAFLVDRFHLLL